MPWRRAADLADLGPGPHADRAPARLVGRRQGAVVDRRCRRWGSRGRAARPAARRVVGRPLGAEHQLAAPGTPRRRLWGGMLVAMPTAMPELPLTSRLGSRAGQADRLAALAVVGGAELDRVLVELAQHVDRGLGQAALGVAVRGRRIVERAEVAVGVDQGDAAGRTAGPCGPAPRRWRCRRGGGSCPSSRRRPWPTCGGPRRGAAPCRPSPPGSGVAPASGRRARRAGPGR